MPRQGVPYPSREICSLKCQIDALQRQINELMKSVNGVEGDGQGNVSLISGDPAIVINSDQVQHEIEISLDQSQLPAAAVSSVNGQTGLVDLDSSDIPMVSGVPTPTVNNKIGAIEGNVTQLQLDLTQEVTDRGNADSTLQTNINAANAAITGKVDKLTTAGDHAYTHNGSTQGETAVVDGTTADTIPIRDANGRMQAADPASGATDKTLVTANWVSQTGDSAPNNLLHRSGAETKTGKLTTTAGIKLTGTNYNVNSLHTQSGSYEVDYIASETNHDLYGLFYDDKNGVEACRDYMRKGDPIAYWEKYFTFKDSNGNTVHPAIRVEWNATTKEVKLIAFGTTIATRSY